MSVPDLASRLAARKAETRRLADTTRRALPGKDELSRRIHERVQAMDAYRSAATVLYYIDVRDEVRTRQALAAAVESDKRIIVPYCVGDGLHLFALDSMDELEPGAYGILEPTPTNRGLPEKAGTVDRVDLILVPGLAFDREGGRLGYGKGYYDRLLAAAPPETPLVGLAFECQIFSAIPMQPHDIYMDWVVTESAAYRGRGRTT